MSSSSGNGGESSYGAESCSPLRYTTTETNFIAEETIVTIIPNFDHPKMRLISGNFGPLESGLPCRVPLWLALTLRKRGKCTIGIPDWMSFASLTEFVQNESASQVLSGVPFFYLEVAQLLLHHAKEDIKDWELVSSKLQDLENIRKDRLRLGALSIADTVNQGQPVVIAKLNNVAAMEIVAIRDLLLNSLDNFLWLNPVAPSDSYTSNPPGASSTSFERTSAMDTLEISDQRDSTAAAGAATSGRKLRKLRGT